MLAQFIYFIFCIQIELITFQMPNATGEGLGLTNTNKGHESKTEWHPQAQVNKADPPRTVTQSKPEVCQFYCIIYV